MERYDYKFVISENISNLGEVKIFYLKNETIIEFSKNNNPVDKWSFERKDIYIGKDGHEIK